MNLQLPSFLPVLVGALLVIFGALRAYQLGWVRRERTNNETGEIEPDPGAKRHLRWGLGWIVLGIFLLVSAAVQRGAG